MQDEAVTAYLPRQGGSRNAWYDLPSYFYDYESRYPRELLTLRQSIVKARPTFPEKLKPLGTFWDRDKSKAFKDLSKGGWFSFWPEKLAPTDTLSRDEFYVADQDDTHLSSIQWDTLYQCEQVIGRYVLERENEVLAQRQNHPINFFYADVKRICKVLAEESDPHAARKQVVVLNTYIRNVRLAIESQSHDGFFIDKLLRFMGADVTRELDAGIEHASLKGEFEKLKKNVGGLKRKAQRILHLGGDKLVPAHPPLEAHGCNAQANPTKAMIDCSKEDLDTRTAVAKRESSYTFTPNALMKKEGGKLKPNTALLSLCEDAPIAETADKSRQEDYLTGLSHLEKLNYHTKLINGILTLFNDAGHINMVLQFSGKLYDYLSVLKQDLTQAQGDLNQYLEGNRERSQQLFLKSEKEGWFGKSLTKEEKAFLANQKVLEQLQYTTVGVPGIEQTLKDIHEVSYRLTDLSRKYQDTQVQQEKVELVTDISEAIDNLKLRLDPAVPQIDFEQKVIEDEKQITGVVSDLGSEKASDPTTLLTSEDLLIPTQPVDEEKLVARPRDLGKSVEYKEDQAPVLHHQNATSLAVPSPSHEVLHSFMEDDAICHAKMDLLESVVSEPEVTASHLSIEDVAPIEKLHAVATYQDTEQDEGMRLSGCMLELNRHTGAIRKVCTAHYARTTIIPKLIEGEMPEGWDIADTYHCHSLPHPFEGGSALYCEGEKTIAYVQYTPPQQALLAESLFNQLGSQVALAGVFYQMGKRLYQWWTSSPQEIIVAEKEVASPILIEIERKLDSIEEINNAYFDELLWMKEQVKQSVSLSDIQTGTTHKAWWVDSMFNDQDAFYKAVSERIVDVKWVKSLIEDHRADLQEYRCNLEKGKLSREVIIDKKEEATYLLSYVTPIYMRETVVAKVEELFDTMTRHMSLERADVDNIEAYFKGLSEQRGKSFVEIDKGIGERYLALVHKLGLSQDLLLEVAEVTFMIKNLLNQDRPLRRSDIVDTAYELDELIKTVEADEVEETEQDARLLDAGEQEIQSVLREDLRLLRNRHYNVWFPEAVSLPKSQFFMPTPKQAMHPAYGARSFLNGQGSSFTFNFS